MMALSILLRSLHHIKNSFLFLLKAAVMAILGICFAALKHFVNFRAGRKIELTYSLCEFNIGGLQLYSGGHRNSQRDIVLQYIIPCSADNFPQLINRMRIKELIGFDRDIDQKRQNLIALCRKLKKLLKKCGFGALTLPVHKLNFAQCVRIHGADFVTVFPAVITLCRSHFDIPLVKIFPEMLSAASEFGKERRHA